MKSLHFPSSLSGLFWLLCTAVLLAACATARQNTYTPEGTWNYTVADTPYGSVSGTMTISREGDYFSGQLQSNIGTAALEDLVINGRELNSTLEIDGNQVSLQGSFDKDSFNGKVKAGYDTYDITANRAR